jgi:outer membrane receptor for Fe3+-dicitrate
VDSLELYTGDVPAEFGAKVSGVAAVSTRSGVDSGRRFFGMTQVEAGQSGARQALFQAGGESGRFAWFTSASGLASKRYLDAVSLDNLHNGGNSERSFFRADYQASPRDQLRFSFITGRSSFQIANLRSQHAHGQDQRQALRDVSFSTGWLHTINSRTTVDAMASFRKADAELIPSVGDFPVTASQDRSSSTLTTGVRLNRDTGRHSLRTGVDYQHFPVRERFTFGTADFLFAKARAGNLYSSFAQDTLRLGRFTITLGLRFDAYRFITEGNQLQPRVGIAYHLRETGTVIRASYNRTYQTPPNENLLLSSSEEAAKWLDRAFVAIRPERQNVYEVGLQQAIGRWMSVNGAFYHKNSRDLQDNDNFLNTGIIFPTSLAQSRTNGAEGRITVLPGRRISGSLSLTHYHTIVTPPFTGGLFVGSSALDQLSLGPFVIDHDQVLGAQGNLQYNVRRNLWISGSVRHDTGLVSNPSNPDEVRNDPDYSDLLPYVNLTSNPPRVRPRTITDLAIGYERFRDDRRAWEAVVQISNVTNQTALYNFQSLFVGTRLVQPRTASVRLRWYF